VSGQAPAAGRPGGGGGRYVGGPLDGRPVTGRRSGYRDATGATLGYRVNGVHFRFVDRPGQAPYVLPGIVFSPGYYAAARAEHEGYYRHDGAGYTFVPPRPRTAPDRQDALTGTPSGSGAWAPIVAEVAADATWTLPLDGPGGQPRPVRQLPTVEQISARYQVGPALAARIRGQALDQDAGASAGRRPGPARADPDSGGTR
jgi:hypothetical protein